MTCPVKLFFSIILLKLLQTERTPLLVGQYFCFYSHFGEDFSLSVVFLQDYNIYFSPYYGDCMCYISVLCGAFSCIFHATFHMYCLKFLKYIYPFFTSIRFSSCRSIYSSSIQYGISNLFLQILHIKVEYHANENPLKIH